MEVFGLLFLVALASAGHVEGVPPAAPQSVLDVYVPTAETPLFHGVDLYQGPVIVLANTSGQQDKGLVAYYADNGIRSIVDTPKFLPLMPIFRSTPNISGLVVGFQGLKDNNFLRNVVREFVLPDNFNLYDLVRESVYPVPIVYVAPKAVFDEHRFDTLEHLARFVIDDLNIDQVPVSYQSQPGLANSRTFFIPPNFSFSRIYGLSPFYYGRSFPFGYHVPPFYHFRSEAPNSRKYRDQWPLI